MREARTPYSVSLWAIERAARPASKVMMEEDFMVATRGRLLCKWLLGGAQPVRSARDEVEDKICDEKDVFGRGRYRDL